MALLHVFTCVVPLVYAYPQVLAFLVLLLSSFRVELDPSVRHEH